MLTYPISVFIDTNIFDRCKYYLEESSPLAILKKLYYDKKIILYTSDIVIREAHKHIESKVNSSHTIFKKCIKEMRNEISPSLLIETDFSRCYSIPPAEGLVKSAISQFDSYIKDLNFKILDSSGVDANQIMNDYFEYNLPFENKERKKDEFPDAFMISKLKMQFSKANPIWIISDDNGFRKSFNGIDGYTPMRTLNELFDMINKEDAKTPYYAIKNYINKNNCNIISLIKDEIIDGNFEIFGMDCDRKGICEGFEYDDASIDTISNFQIKLNSIDYISDNNISVTVKCTADISVFCYFDDYSNSAWDSEEGEFLFVDRGSAIEEHSAEFISLIEFSIESTADILNFEVEKIEINLTLDQFTRTNREVILSDSINDYEAEMMEALENNYIDSEF